MTGGTAIRVSWFRVSLFGQPVKVFLLMIASTGNDKPALDFGS